MTKIYLAVLFVIPSTFLACGSTDKPPAEECPTTGENGTIDLVFNNGSFTGSPHIMFAPSATPDATMAFNGTQASVPPGKYLLSSIIEKIKDSPAGHAFDACFSTTQEVCVKAKTSTPVSVSYVEQPGSGKLWATISQSDSHTISFNGADLLSGGAKTAAAHIKLSVTSASTIAFDGEGNVWIGDLGAGTISGYRNADLGTDISAAPFYTTDVMAQCSSVPCLVSMAFDAENTLWVGLAQDKIVSITHDNLLGTGTPSVTITGPSIQLAEALAFDTEGNLWVANGAGETVVKFDKSRLTSDITTAADVEITAQSKPPVVLNLANPNSLAFDQNGLWVAYGAGTIALLPTSALGATATITPDTQFGLDVLGLAESITFDGAGNLWFPGKQGEIVSIAAKDLLTFDPATSPTQKMTSADFQYAEQLVFQLPPAPIRSPEALSSCYEFGGE